MSMLPPLSGRVVVVGDVMQDIVVRPSGAIRIGSDQAAEISILPGGSGANMAVALARQGLEILFIGRVGASDQPQLMAQFGDMGVLAHLHADDQRTTGRLICLIGEDGERSFLTDRGANAGLSSADIPDDWSKGTGFLQVSAYALLEAGPRGAVAQMVLHARNQNIPVGVDAASVGFVQDMGVDVFFAATAGFDILFANEDEAALLSRETDSDLQLEMLLKRYGIVVIKQGAAGAISGSQDGARANAIAPQVEIVDTTGAGDAFLAGFVAQWSKGGGLQACLEAGNDAGAAAVSKLGAQA